MAAHRKLDVVLDSLKRLQRMGATANILNLLPKQHLADLAQILGELPNRDRHAIFKVLSERNVRLAMEALSELGPESGADLLSDRPPEEIARLVQELPTDDAAALVDNLLEDLSTAVLELMRRKKGGEVENLLEYPEQTVGRINGSLSSTPPPACTSGTGVPTAMSPMTPTPVRTIRMRQRPTSSATRCTVSASPTMDFSKSATVSTIATRCSSRMARS